MGNIKRGLQLKPLLALTDNNQQEQPMKTIPISEYQNDLSELYQLSHDSIGRPYSRDLRNALVRKLNKYPKATFWEKAAAWLNLRSNGVFG